LSNKSNSSTSKKKIKNSSKKEKIVKKQLKKESKKVYKVDVTKCTGCKECVGVCPTRAITMIMGKAVIDPKKCVNCGLCAQVCPVNAPEKSEVKQ
jgi:ferredoxin